MEYKLGPYGLVPQRNEEEITVRTHCRRHTRMLISLTDRAWSHLCSDGKRTGARLRLSCNLRGTYRYILLDRLLMKSNSRVIPASALKTASMVIPCPLLVFCPQFA